MPRAKGPDVQLTWNSAPEILTVTQAAELSNLHINTVRNMIHDGRLIAFKPVGTSHWRISKVDLLSLAKPYVFNRSELVEMIVGLYYALESRVGCTNCGGAGKNTVWLGEDEAEWEPCSCETDAHELLCHYKDLMTKVVGEYLLSNGLNPQTLEVEWDTLGDGLLERVKAGLKT